MATYRVRNPNQQYAAQQRAARQQAAAAEQAARAGARARSAGGSGGGAGGGKSGDGGNGGNGGRDRPPRPPKPSVDPYRQEVRARTRLEFGEREREIDQALADSATRQQNNTNWFADYQDQLEKSRIAQASFYQGQTSIANQFATETGTVNTNPEGQPLTSDSAKAADVRNALQQAFAEALRQQGITFNAAKEDQKGVAAASQLTARLAEDEFTKRVREDQRDLALDKGAFKTKTRADLMDENWRQELEASAFNLDRDQALADIAGDAAERRDRRRENRSDRNAKLDEVNQYGYTNRDWARMTPEQRRQAYKEWQAAGRAPKPVHKRDDGLTPTQRRNLRQQRNEARSEVETAVATMGALGNVPMKILDDQGEDTGKTRAPTREEIFARMRDEGYSQDQIKVALAIRHGDQTWDKETREAARRIGYGVPKRFRPKPYTPGDARGEATK